MNRLDELFDVRYGHSLELNRLVITKPELGIPFISRKSGDNGIAAYVERLPDIEPNPAGELTCALSGNALSTFIQEQPYYTAYHIACLRPLFDFNKVELLYYCACIYANRYRYNYGRQANRSIRNLLLPSRDEIPKWIYSTCINQFENADAPDLALDTPQLFDISWAPFLLSSLFDVRKGKRLTKAAMLPGKVPFIGSIDSNNGVSCYVGQKAIHSGNTITVNYNGSVAEAFYQTDPFWACDDVNVLYPKFKLTSTIALFLVTVIRNEKYRFNYGRKWHKERMEQSTIYLPIKSDGSPDWDYMSTFIRTLQFSSNI